MAEAAMLPRSALAGAPPLPLHAGEAAGVTLGERTAERLFVLLARRNQAAALGERLRGHGLVLPEPNRRVASRGHAVTWTGPAQWLVEAEAAEADRLEKAVGSFAALGSTVTLDDARGLLQVGGPRARETLGKMMSLDLHPRAFKAGDAAVTVAGHMSVTLWLREDAPVFECAVPRSVLRSFWDWLVSSAAEYGVAPHPAGDRHPPA